MPPVHFGQPTKAEIEKAAHAAVTGLKTCGFASCLVGSVACMAYGMTRTPNDVDIVVLDSTFTQEDIKRRLVAVDPMFFLVPSTNPRATYKVLWYNLRAVSFYPFHACKVDILIPGVLNIPTIPDQFVNHIQFLGHGLVPVAPFVTMLLLKLQGWRDHRDSHRTDLRLKQHVDVLDINELLQIAVRDKKIIVGNEAWLPPSFVGAGRLRVSDFIRAFPTSRAYWSRIGLVSRRVLEA